MTELPPLSDDDLSLALDGEADAALLARIDARPEAQARLAELRAAQELLGSASVPALDDDAVDQLVATAVDTPVPPEHGRSRGQRHAAPWIVAAAVILLMAVGLSLVWAGRSDDQDQASASLTSQDSTAEPSAGKAAADSSFSGAGTAASEVDTGAHGAPTTTVTTVTGTAAVPVLYLGSYPTAADLRTATATSLGDAWKRSDTRLQYDGDDEESTDRTNRSANPPAQAAIDRCADQLRVTLSMKAGPIQTGYATVDGKDVLVYEFATASARDADRETTLVAAVGADACDEVVIFER
ncbi:MAG TPA: hypothetical protein VNQ33_05795 [Acidimicrobiales bacterium]|nr:hypothetical protein [Acidimicrobiales bacterium]